MEGSASTVGGAGLAGPLRVGGEQAHLGQCSDQGRHRRSSREGLERVGRRMRCVPAGGPVWVGDVPVIGAHHGQGHEGGQVQAGIRDSQLQVAATVDTGLRVVFGEARICGHREERDPRGSDRGPMCRPPLRALPSGEVADRARRVVLVDATVEMVPLAPGEGRAKGRQRALGPVERPRVALLQGQHLVGDGGSEECRRPPDDRTDAPGQFWPLLQQRQGVRAALRVGDHQHVTLRRCRLTRPAEVPCLVVAHALGQRRGEVGHVRPAPPHRVSIGGDHPQPEPGVHQGPYVAQGQVRKQPGQQARGEQHSQPDQSRVGWVRLLAGHLVGIGPGQEPGRELLTCRRVGQHPVVEPGQGQGLRAAGALDREQVPVAPPDPLLDQGVAQASARVGTDRLPHRSRRHLKLIRRDSHSQPAQRHDGTRVGRSIGRDTGTSKQGRRLDVQGGLAPNTSPSWTATLLAAARC